MTCEFVFLDVGNADAIIIRPADGRAVVVDVPNARAITDWLASHLSDLGAVFITHAHRDHFASIEHFVAFLEQWARNGRSPLEIFVSLDTLKAAFTRLRQLESNDPKLTNPRHDSLKHALDYLMLWREKRFHIQDAIRDPKPHYESSLLNVYVLHPESLYLASHSANASQLLNERSVVLRLAYGNFSALLLADLEGTGVDECLALCGPTELKAQLVKIPHHGAWPTNSSNLEDLLKKVDAEIAVLSVGSSNHHGHVVPELFRFLVGLKADAATRMKTFV